jgi:hypothetical protein
MTFVLGSVLFLLGGFLGMLIMSFGISIRDQLPKETNATLRIVENNE